MDRYIDEETVAKERLSGLPSLIKLAWNIALILPELGDEIIADLCADAQLIVERDAARMAADADAAAAAKAKEFWHDRLKREYQRSNDLIVSLASAISPEGINPHGYYVYLLWPEKGADKPIYVGRSRNVLSRLGTHMDDWERRHATSWVSIIDCHTEAAMIKIEGKLIAHYQPMLNVAGVRW